MGEEGAAPPGIGSTIVRGRWVALGLFALLIALSVLVLPDLRFELGLDRVLEPSDEELLRVQEFYQEVRPAKVNAILVLTFRKRIERTELDRVARIVDGLDSEPHISVVTSLATVTVVDQSVDVPLPRRFPETVGDRTVYEAAWSHPLLRRTLLSQDGRSTAIQVAAPRPGSNAVDRLLDRVRERAPQLAGADVTVRVLGGTVIDRTLRDRMVEDILRITGLEVLLFAILLPILFRTARGSLLPLLVVVGAVVFNFAWMAVLDLPFAIIDIAVPGLIVIIGLCDAIHMVHRFEEEFGSGVGRREAIARMVSKVGRACFYTSFTTAVGFLSLLVTDHATVRAFGVKAAASVAVTFVVVVTLVPAGLALWPIKRPVAMRHVRLLRLAYGRPVLTALAAAAVVSLSAIGIHRVDVNSYLLEEFPADDPIAMDLIWFQRHFSGVIDLEAQVTGALDDPRVFARLEQLQDTMLAEDGVTRVESYTMWVREALGNPEGPLSATQIRAAVARLRLVPGVFPDALVNRELDQARLVFLVRDVGARRTAELRGRMEDLAGTLPKSTGLQPAGYTFMATEAAQLVVDSMVRSLGASLLAITLFICLIFRSIKIGLISLVPNLLPLAIALGVSGWLDIDLRIGSALIYCLGLGLAVDDTIHLVARYLQERRERPSAPPRDTLLIALRSSGRALVTTSMVLGVGTLCHLAGSFESIRQVGILLFTVVVSALVADLWLLPHLLQRARVR